MLTEARGVARRGHEVLLAAPADSRIYAEAQRYGIIALPLPDRAQGRARTRRAALAPRPAPRSTS